MVVAYYISYLGEEIEVEINLKNLILGTTIFEDDNFVIYFTIGLGLGFVGCIVYVIVSYIEHLKDEKSDELLDKIIFSGLWHHYNKDEKGRWYSIIERNEKEKAKAKKREDRKNKLKLLKSKLKFRK